MITVADILALPAFEQVQPLVLCEGKKGKSYYGRSQMEAPESDGKIWFTSERPIAPGEFVRVKIIRAEPYDLYGEAIQ